MKNDFELFLSFSQELTGFDRIQLLGTGLAFSYFEVVTERTGQQNCSALWEQWSSILSDSGHIETSIRVKVLSNPQFGPMARNIIKLWYLGQWQSMPSHWRSVYGNHLADIDEIISGETYKEGLVWPAISAHPMGAKQTGFDSWSGPPEEME